MSSLAIAAYRLLFASLLLFPFSIKKTIADLKNKSLSDFLLIILSGILLAVHFGSWILSLEFITVMISVVLVTTTPIWVAMMSPLITKEKISRRFWVGLFFSMIGIIFASGLWQDDALTHVNIFNLDQFYGNGLALLGAFCAAGYVIIGRLMRHKISNQSYTLSVYSSAALILILAVILLPTETILIERPAFKWLVFLAIIPQIIGHSLINWFLGSQPAHQVSIYLLGEPIGSTIMAALFLQEIPGIQESIGALVILIGILIAAGGRKDAHKDSRKTI